MAGGTSTPETVSRRRGGGLTPGDPGDETVAPLGVDGFDAMNATTAAATRSAERRASSLSSRSGVGVTSINAAIRNSGTGRLRVLAIAMMSQCAIGASVALVLPAPTSTRVVAITGVTLLCGTFIWLLRRLSRGSEPLDIQANRALIIWIGVWVVVTNYAFGLTSAFAAAPCLGITLASSSMSKPHAFTHISAIVGTFWAVSALVVFDVIPNAPLLPTVLPDGWLQSFCLLLVSLLYIGGHLAGTMVRTDNARVVGELEAAVRQTAQQEALLVEAREALERAAGLGEPGRFTDQKLDGYELGVVVGRGGMGEVYEATHPDHERPVALKLMRRDVVGDPEMVKRFVREARIAAAIDSPHVVHVVAVGDATTTALPYIAMELLQGADLASLLRDQGTLKPPSVLALVTQVAEGLTAAHEAKVVHRDLKPNNVFHSTDADGQKRWKVLDFGVSKLLGGDDPTLTAAQMVGTPQYMAPEQAAGSEVDSRADVYGLAVVAYRSLTGAPPFSGELPAMLRAIQEEMPRAPSSHVKLPRQLDDAFAIAMAKLPEDRFSSVREFAQALRLAHDGRLSPALRDRARRLLSERPWAA